MEYRGHSVVVFALPRGGVVLGVEIARRIQAPLDLIVVRKIGHPQSSEYGIGAVTEDGDIVLNREETEALDPDWIAKAAQAQLREARRRRAAYLHGRPPTSVTGKTAIIVDDGLATGLTMEAAIQQLKRQEPSRVIVAVPVATRETVNRLGSQVDEMTVLHSPVVFGAVGAFYRDFSQVSDAEVVALMKSSVDPE